MDHLNRTHQDLHLFETICEECLPTFMIPGVSIKPSAAVQPPWLGMVHCSDLNTILGAKRGGIVMTTIRNYHRVSQINIYINMYVCNCIYVYSYIYICRKVNPYWNSEYSDYDYIHCFIFLVMTRFATICCLQAMIYSIYKHGSEFAQAWSK